MITNHAPFYVSVDLETTGLDPVEHQVLEFAAVAWTNDGPVMDLPYCHFYVQPRGNIVGHPYALSMNKRILDRLANGEGYDLNVVLTDFTTWLKSLGVSEQSKTCIVGQNFAGFDLQFLDQWEVWPKHLINHRYFDLSTICADRQGMKSAGKVLEEVPEITGEPHEALYDARWALFHAREWLTTPK